MIIRVDRRATGEQAWQLCLEWSRKSNKYIFLCEWMGQYILTDGDPIGEVIIGCPMRACIE